MYNIQEKPGIPKRIIRCCSRIAQTATDFVETTLIHKGAKDEYFIFFDPQKRCCVSLR